MDIDFIKWLCGKAKGFDWKEHSHKHHGTAVKHESGFYHSDMTTDLFLKMSYPLLLQRAIEGVNRLHLNDNSYPVTIIDAWDIEVRFYNSGYKDLMKGLDNWDSIDQAKESALRYIYDQENK